MKHSYVKMLVLGAVIALAAGCESTPLKNEPDKGAEAVDTIAPVKADTLTAEQDREEVLRHYEEDGMSHAQSGENNPGRQVVYLTFDDGPSRNTPKILDILKHYDVHATFFVVGHNKDFIDCIGRAHREGHAIAAHTYTHKFDIYKSQQTYFDDLEQIEKVIEEQTGSRTPIIRFPGGSSNLVYFRQSQDSIFMIKLTQEVLNRGYQYVDWNVSSNDASRALVPASEIIRHACSVRHNDVCLLMHDASAKTTTVEALPTIIEFYKNKGYEFGTITDISYICHHGIKPYTEPASKQKAKNHAAAADTTNSGKKKHSKKEHKTGSYDHSDPAPAAPEEHSVPVNTSESTAQGA